MEPFRNLLEVSSFYGPGAVACWLCSFVSVVIAWTLNPSSRRKDVISNDLIAVLSYPTIAAIHMLYETFCITKLWPERPSTEDVKTLRASATVAATLVICETFGILVLALLACTEHRRQHRRFFTVILSIMCFYSTH